MIIEKKTKDKITVSFSGSIGKSGLTSIKKYVEYLEKASKTRRKKLSQTSINRLADDISAAAWKRLKKERGL